MRVLRERGPDRRAEWPSTPHDPSLNILVYAAAAFLTALVTYLLVVGDPIFKPLVIALLAWHLINGMVGALANVSERIRIRGKTLARSVRLIVASGAVIALLYAMVKVMVGNMGQVVTRAPMYEQSLRNAANMVNGWLGLQELTNEQPLFEMGPITALVRALARQATGMLGTGGTVAVFVLFLLLEQNVFSRKITVLFPNPEREVRVRRILQQIGTEVQSYLWMKTLMGLLVTGLSYVVMRAVGLDLAAFWALLIFALSYIPYIGAWVGVIFPTALALVQFEITTPFFVTAELLAVIQFTCGSILEPRIMGKGPQYQPDGDVAMPFDLGRNLGHRRDVPRSTHHGGRDDCLLTLRSHTPGGDPAVG